MKTLLATAVCILHPETLRSPAAFDDSMCQEAARRRRARESGGRIDSVEIPVKTKAAAGNLTK